MVGTVIRNGRTPFGHPMEKKIELNNYVFNYKSIGYQSIGNSTRCPLLFLHGFMGDCHEFDEIISLLSEEFYCLAVDLPGHGKTRTTGEDKHYRMENIARASIEFLDALDIDRCISIGYSMGGRLALYLALHFPKYFDRVVLESASPGLKTQEEREARVRKDLKLAQELEVEDLSSFLNRWYSQPLFSSMKKYPGFSKMLAQRLQNNAFELSKSLRNLSTGLQPSLWNALRENSVPLLLLVGELDEKFIGINTEMVSSCKFGRLEIVRNCGHNIHLESPISFARRIRHFVTPDGSLART